jgi:transcriptional regulator with XRE-family HTH domain
MNLQEYGALICEYRKKAKLTQQQLGEETGLNRVTISLIETGAIPEIGVRKLSRLCMRLGLEIKITPMEHLQLPELLQKANAERIKGLEEASRILSQIKITPKQET